MNLDAEFKKATENVEFPVPIYDRHLFNISFFIWKKPEIHLELVETWPYAPDGDVPMLMIQFGWIEIMFYSKRLYRYFYRKKYNEDPAGL